MKQHRRRDCPHCVSNWVDLAIMNSRVVLTAKERRQLIAALLARRHLLLTGAAGVGKRRLAQALADVMTDGQSDRVRVLQGHPWWADQTGDVTSYVTAQMNYSIWRLEDFVANAVSSINRGRTQSAVMEMIFALVVERMSPVETDYYFHLFNTGEGSTFFTSGRISGVLKVLGTCDANEPPDLPDELERTVARIHLGQASTETVQTG